MKKIAGPFYDIEKAQKELEELKKRLIESPLGILIYDNSNFEIKESLSTILEGTEIYIVQVEKDELN